MEKAPADWSKTFTYGFDETAGSIFKRAATENPLTVETCFDIFWIIAINPSITVSGLPESVIKETTEFVSKEITTFNEQWIKALATYKTQSAGLLAMERHKQKLLDVYNLLLRQPHAICNCPTCELKMRVDDYYPRSGRN